MKRRSGRPVVDWFVPPATSGAFNFCLGGTARCYRKFLPMPDNCVVSPVILLIASTSRGAGLVGDLQKRDLGPIFGTLRRSSNTSNSDLEVKPYKSKAVSRTAK